MVAVKPKRKAVAITKIADGRYDVTLTAPAHDGKANVQLRAALADYFGVSIGMVTIKSGLTAKTKVVIISG